MAEKEENATSGNVEQEVAGGCITEVVLLCTNTVHKACPVQFFVSHCLYRWDIAGHWWPCPMVDSPICSTASAQPLSFPYSARSRHV